MGHRSNYDLRAERIDRWQSIRDEPFAGSSVLGFLTFATSRFFRCTRDETFSVEILDREGRKVGIAGRTALVQAAITTAISNGEFTIRIRPTPIVERSVRGRSPSDRHVSRNSFPSRENFPSHSSGGKRRPDSHDGAIRKRSGTICYVDVQSSSRREESRRSTLANQQRAPRNDRIVEIVESEPVRPQHEELGPRKPCREISNGRSVVKKDEIRTNRRPLSNKASLENEENDAPWVRKKTRPEPVPSSSTGSSNDGQKKRGGSEQIQSVADEPRKEPHKRSLFSETSSSSSSSSSSSTSSSDESERKTNEPDGLRRVVLKRRRQPAKLEPAKPERMAYETAESSSELPPTPKAVSLD